MQIITIFLIELVPTYHRGKTLIFYDYADSDQNRLNELTGILLHEHLTE